MYVKDSTKIFYVHLHDVSVFLTVFACRYITKGPEQSWFIQSFGM